MTAITLVRSHNFSAKLIHIGMFLWCILRLKKPVKTFNHIEIRCGEYTSGAVPEGVKTRKWEPYISRIKNVEWIDYELNITDSELKHGQMFLKMSEGIPYEFENFIWHLIKIITGVWVGSKSNNHTYCYEHVIRFLNYTFDLKLDPFLNPYEFKVWIDKHYNKETKRFV